MLISDVPLSLLNANRGMMTGDRRIIEAQVIACSTLGAPDPKTLASKKHFDGYDVDGMPV